MSHENAESVGVTAAHQPVVEDIVIRLVSEMAPDFDGRATPDQGLVTDLGYYSLLMIELAFALEELFGLDQMTAEDAPPIGTVRDLQEYVVRKVDAGLATVPEGDTVEEYLRMR